MESLIAMMLRENSYANDEILIELTIDLLEKKKNQQITKMHQISLKVKWDAVKVLLCFIFTANEFN